jgi:hypothetical protein
MKQLCLLFCLFALQIIALSQSPQRVQLTEILKEASDNFENLKGAIKRTQPDDSLYTSAVTVEGTKNNAIEVFSDRFVQYYAYIADSATKNSAQALITQWRKKIKEAVPNYEELPIRSSIKKRKIEGYRFIRWIDKTAYTVTVMLSKRGIDDYYCVLLTVTKQWSEAVEKEVF